MNTTDKGNDYIYNIRSHCLIIHDFYYLFSGLIKGTGFNEDFLLLWFLEINFIFEICLFIYL